MKSIVLISFIILSVCSAAGQAGFSGRLADSALTLTRQTVHYDPHYFKISYPNGDVPADKGVCSDVLIRAYRKLGIDLQKDIHDDMNAHFDKYPKLWGLSHTDTNIDHRRVPNMMAFFSRHASVKKISADPIDYMPGDIVCWNLGGSVTHIGIVSDSLSNDRKRYLIIHNIGRGQTLEDCLFSFKIVGHYMYEK